ncbi:MAG: hypothetical protein M1547_05730 [Gammaproteobacteria bacterium]|nr:hypothetical protein [Gammaproteobacteria bacterium]
MGKLSQMLLRKIIPLLLLLIPLSAEAIAEGNNASTDEGIRFSCKPGQLETIASDMETYLAALGVAPDLVVKKADRTSGAVVYTLNTPKEDSSTLDLKDRPELQIRDDIVSLPTKRGKEKKVHTVSKKEILLALLQHGRLTEFKDGACDVEALKDHVGIRQNTVAWAENLNWVWPDGRPAKWNNKYWKRGTPKPGYPLHEALSDVFVNQNKYSIGCYTATKIVVIQGVLDYYRRIKKDPAQLKRLENRLSIDKEPLVNIEPGKMWDFEKDFDPRELNRPGKLLKIESGAAPKNFVPGDWVHFLNTDPVTYEKTGYEGSNPIYLGRNKFADYFNDNDHSYTYQQKADEVYQWRNGVFSRSRDFAKIKPLSPRDMERLSKTHAEGGILRDIRVLPYFFGYEALPVWGSPPSFEIARQPR